MAVCYKKLWKLLIDKNMNKTELRTATGITTTSLAKLGRNENVNTEVLVKICKALDCNIEDIMEIVGEE
jgi:DNA-binding Xre family transcriptional regulator